MVLVVLATYKNRRKNESRGHEGLEVGALCASEKYSNISPDTGYSTQTVASRDRRMDRCHIVGMCKYKAKYSFSLRQISLIFIG
jgi:hypothetical protein